MKIISKFKDYYDYKVAEYGIDENLVYDRRLPPEVGMSLPQRSWLTFDDPTEDEALHSCTSLPHALKYTPIGILPTLRIGITAYMICGMATAMC